MAAPEWILTAQGDLIDAVLINFIQVINKAVVITMQNGTTINYSYASEALALASLVSYETVLQSVSLVPDSPTVLAFDSATTIYSWNVPASGVPILDYLLMWGPTSGGPYPNSISVNSAATTITAADAGINLLIENFVVIVARSTVADVSDPSNEVSNSVSIIALIPLMTSVNTPSGTVTSSSTRAVPFADYQAFGSIQGWNAVGGPPAWIQYQFALNNRLVTEYDVGPFGSGSPKNWTLEGSNDGLGWTVLDTQINYTFTGNDHFTFSNSTAYGYYRWNITDTHNNAADTNSSKLQLYGIVV